MEKIMKPARNLTPSDLEQFPVWEFILDMEEELPDETWVRPVVDLPVDDLGNRIVGTRLILNQGDSKWAILSNVSLDDPFRTEQFMYVSVMHNDRWIDLARYHDLDYERSGPDAFARSLGMSLEQIFPMHYDLSKIAIGRDDAIKSQINREPSQRLTKDELRELIFKKK